MSQQNLMILPTLSSNISFHTDAEIHYVDMTALFKQEKKHRLRHSHPTHITCMWFLHFIVEVQNWSAWHAALGHLFCTNYLPLLQWSHSSTDRTCFPEIPLDHTIAQNQHALKSSPWLHHQGKAP